MEALRHGKFRLAALVAISALAIGIAGCEGDDGDDGPAGPAGADGEPGPQGDAGLACWDLNGNGVGDFELDFAPFTEDINGDGEFDAFDCNPLANIPDEGVVAKFHSDWFAEKTYESADDCLVCHGAIGDDILTTAHWKWEGTALGIDGLEGQTHGKKDIINNFCVAVPTNEGRCAQCHIGIGWNGTDFDFRNPSNIDCLVCHDQTGEYKKAPTTAGAPPADLDLQPIDQSVARNDGVPTRDNCIFCHSYAGGDDNVKHGDLAFSIANTTREYDVHMGTDGGDMDCVLCHDVERDGDNEPVSHGIGGMAFHSNDEGTMRYCTDCHSGSVHVGKPVEIIFSSHTTLACQVCHIPTFARETSTKTFWDWSTAGDDTRVPQDDPVDPSRKDYDIKKGDFTWAFNVRPTLLYQERHPDGYGKWEKTVINRTEGFTEQPVVLARPAGDRTTPGAMIYPFKEMPGKQPADAVNNIILVPHLYPGSDGPNGYWKFFDWDLALQDAAAQTGQPYSGQHTFVDTVMYLSVNHEIAPKEQAYGYGGVESCSDCHGGDQIDWTKLGCTGDPTVTGNDCP
jgi:octaheme c-type cytochrome (tetrathionate reductase family)